MDSTSCGFIYRGNFVGALIQYINKRFDGRNTKKMYSRSVDCKLTIIMISVFYRGIPEDNTRHVPNNPSNWGGAAGSKQGTVSMLSNDLPEIYRFSTDLRKMSSKIDTMTRNSRNFRSALTLIEVFRNKILGKWRVFLPLSPLFYFTLIEWRPQMQDLWEWRLKIAHSLRWLIARFRETHKSLVFSNAQQAT